MSKLKILAGILLILISTSFITAQASPKPTALIVRKLVEKSIETKPSNFDEMQKKVTVFKDIKYPSVYKSNTLDVFVPKDDSRTSFPVIIWTHGGFFVGGDKNQVQVFATALASHGYVVVSLNYERAPESKYPNQLKQIAEVCDFVLDDPDSYRIDSSQIFFAGDSAGAQMTAQFVALQSNASYASEVGVPKIIPESSLKGALLYCGPYNLEKIVESNASGLTSFIFEQIGWAYLGEKKWATAPVAQQVNIYNYIGSSYPPAFITDGNKGSFESHGRALVEHLSNNGVDVYSLFFPAETVTEHEYQFKLDTEPGQKAFDQTIEFLQRYSN